LYRHAGKPIERHPELPTPQQAQPTDPMVAPSQTAAQAGAQHIMQQQQQSQQPQQGQPQISAQGIRPAGLQQQAQFQAGGFIPQQQQQMLRSMAPAQMQGTGIVGKMHVFSLAW
jgi:hypothetical protein